MPCFFLLLARGFRRATAAPTAARPVRAPARGRVVRVREAGPVRRARVLTSAARSAEGSKRRANDAALATGASASRD